jgi:hypothetical protein
MRVHAAVWQFDASSGNDYAGKYVNDRILFNEKEHGKRDSKWLRGHGGKRLRNMWLGQPIHVRTLLMSTTPDTSFPAGTTGVLDERFQKSGKVKGSRQTSKEIKGVPSRAALETQLQHSQLKELPRPAERLPVDDPFDKHKALMKTARSNYHRLASKEHLLKLQTEYDRGILAGVIEATVLSVKHAILLAKYQDSASTAEEAYKTVCEGVSDVLGTALGTTRWDPDREAGEDPPSPEFAALKMEKAHTAYKRSVLALH